MKRISIFLALGLVVPVVVSAQQAKRRVAVINFDYSTVYSGVSAVFGNNIDVGKGVADLLVDRLVAEGVYSVVERKGMDKLVAEQNFSNSDRANPATAARLGQLLGVDVVIIGSITTFGRDDKTTQVGGLGSVAGRYGISGVGKKEAKAVVGLTARIVSVDTGEVLVSAKGDGQSTRTGASVTGSGGTPSAMGGGAYDMSSKNFASTLIGEAVNKAVDQLSGQLNQSADRVPIRTLRIKALVADVSGSTIIINLGARAGVKVGDRLEVVRQGREIRDPETGRVIKRVTDAVGTLEITEVEDLSATGKFSGSMPPQVGDLVRSPEK